MSFVLKGQLKEIDLEEKLKKKTNNCGQQGFCKIRATEYRFKDICNSNRLLYLGRINEKVTAKQATGILIPVLRKAPNVAGKFMFNFKNLPLRQKILIGLTILSGLLIIVYVLLNPGSNQTINSLIFGYAIGVPLAVLVTDAIIDLNDNGIFLIWLTIGLITFCISLLTHNSERFVIHRDPAFDSSSRINSLIATNSTSSLKALLIFLIAYWPLNKYFNKLDLYIINTFRQGKWYHDIAKRDITGLDVFINFVLAGIIGSAALFGY